jgi:hypothetical protein
MSTIATVCAIASSMIGGRAHDRHSVAKDFGLTVASADRHLRHLLTVPGFVSRKQGRRLLVTFAFSAALRARGL